MRDYDYTAVNLQKVKHKQNQRVDIFNLKIKNFWRPPKREYLSSRHKICFDAKINRNHSTNEIKNVLKLNKLRICSGD